MVVNRSPGSGRSTSHRPSEKIPQSNARIDPPFPFLFKVPRALEAGFEVPYKRVYSPLYGEFMLSIKLGSSCIVSFPQYYVKDGRPQQPRSSGCVRVAIKQTPQAKKGQRKTSMSFISRTYEALEWGIQLNFRHMENGPLSWVISDIKRGCPLPTGDNEKKGVELDCFESEWANHLDPSLVHSHDGPIPLRSERTHHPAQADCFVKEQGGRDGEGVDDQKLPIGRLIRNQLLTDSGGYSCLGKVDGVDSDGLLKSLDYRASPDVRLFPDGSQDKVGNFFVV
ncbi:hypothetical protein BSKO_02874 [Bryopsis sp. KO-2023]|nr:hypothetical protein BSKO_02874 [Bryopsis sp. KO-2023]